jgi:hypothetical protein
MEVVVKMIVEVLVKAAVAAKGMLCHVAIVYDISLCVKRDGRLGGLTS